MIDDALECPGCHCLAMLDLRVLSVIMRDGSRRGPADERIVICTNCGRWLAALPGKLVTVREADDVPLFTINLNVHSHEAHQIKQALDALAAGQDAMAAKIIGLQSAVTDLSFLVRKPRIRFFTGKPLREITMLRFTEKGKPNADLALKVLDKDGDPASLDGVPQWASSDPNIVSVVPSEDGLSAVATRQNLGVAVISLSADADLGEGVRNIVGTLDVQVVGGEAVSVEITAGEPRE